MPSTYHPFWLFVPNGPHWHQLSWTALLFVEPTAGGTRWVSEDGEVESSLDWDSFVADLPSRRLLQIQPHCVIALHQVQAFGADWIEIPKHRLPVEPRIAKVLRRQLPVLGQEGCRLDAGFGFLWLAN